MDQEHLEASLRDIRQTLSLLQGEVTVLEATSSRLLLALEKKEGVIQGGAIERDLLTGLLKKQAFFKKWQKLMAECQKLQDHCGILVIEIDCFKQLREAHGQRAGDDVIQRVAEMLNLYASPRCLVSRMENDGFALAMRGTDAEVLGVAEILRREAERMHGDVSEKVKWKCTLSMGMASSGKWGYQTDSLLRAAGLALTAVKKKGKNTIGAA